jgi:LPS export ABC transporter protein LptC
MPTPGATLHGVVFDAYRAGSRSVRLTATSAEVDWAGSEVLMERVRISLPGEERGPVDVQATEARIDLGSRGFELRGGVVASTGEGERFETKALQYLPDRGVLVSRDPVHVKGTRLELVGSGMELDVSTRHVRLLGPVRASTEPR